MVVTNLDRNAIDSLLAARHGDPFSVLGRHEIDGQWVVRALLPQAMSVSLIDRQDGSVLADMKRLHSDGLFEAALRSRPDYRLHLHLSHGSRVIEDPYAFGSTLSSFDLHLIAEGRHRELQRCLGAHLMSIDDVKGIRFAVWAPNALRASVVGDFNDWDGRRHPMRRHPGAGIWEIFIPGLAAGAIYKFEMIGPRGEMLPLKADPMALAAEVPPRTASVATDLTMLRWTDSTWRAHRAERQTAESAISIYEVHAASWLPDDPSASPDWDILGDRLLPYVARLGFTHLELMPIMEHPFGGSWGYQPLGQFAPMARLGSPQAFARFVDRAHASGIGIILDWVPAHFPSDAHGLARFDGTALYEHADPREGFHPDWNTYIYNLGRNEVRGMLIASALHWLETYHVDGLRVDAVASMLYRDYSRAADAWIPNRYGGRENLESISFLQELSDTVATRCPGAVLIAEESTAWPGVTRSPRDGGLGFQFKWNMGWMHDTLDYMQEDSVNRCYHHHKMTFGLVYAFSEQFVLPLSHDEVVHGKGSLLRRMPGDEWQKFANLRAYLGFMWSHPGKKLIFMGGEFAQYREWNHDQGLDWSLLDVGLHAGVQSTIRDLNMLYRNLPALHRADSRASGFRWVVLDDAAQSVFGFLRYSDQADDAPVLVICNFTPVPRAAYRVGVPLEGVWRERLNTDALEYGGSGMGNGGGVTTEPVGAHELSVSLVLTLPPLATLILSFG
jgi:1,4-alpha-glucan branching enzyme